MVPGDTAGVGGIARPKGGGGGGAALYMGNSDDPEFHTDMMVGLGSLPHRPPYSAGDWDGRWRAGTALTCNPSLRLYQVLTAKHHTEWAPRCESTSFPLYKPSEFL